jgi:hypothetical protein
MMLSAPSFAEIICASTFIYPNVLGAFLAPVAFLAFLSLVVAIALASKHHKSATGGTWTVLTIAGVLQIATFIMGASRA